MKIKSLLIFAVLVTAFLCCTHPVNSETAWCHTFNTNLGYAQSGSSEVGYLHTALDKEGISYSPDTGDTYGSATAEAVATFQEKYASEVLTPYGLKEGSGYVAIGTRTKLNTLYGCPVTSTATPASDTGLVSSTSTSTTTGSGTITITHTSTVFPNNTLVYNNKKEDLYPVWPTDFKSKYPYRSGPDYWCHTFTNNIDQSMNANYASYEVGELQIALAREEFSCIGGLNAYDNCLTDAVKKFQAKYGISQTGTVGPETRAKLNELYGCAGDIAATDPRYLIPDDAKNGTSCEGEDDEYLRVPYKTKYGNYTYYDIFCPYGCDPILFCESLVCQEWGRCREKVAIKSVKTFNSESTDRLDGTPVQEIIQKIHTKITNYPAMFFGHASTESHQRGSGTFDFWFDYGPTTAYGSRITKRQIYATSMDELNREDWQSPRDVGTGGIIYAEVPQVAPGTYHVRLVASTVFGTVYGNDVVVTIPEHSTTSTDQCRLMPDWYCSQWSYVRPEAAKDSLNGGQHLRICMTPYNKIGTDTSYERTWTTKMAYWCLATRPEIHKQVSCIPNWKCSDWSYCETDPLKISKTSVTSSIWNTTYYYSNATHATRGCSDLNHCPGQPIQSKPVERILCNGAGYCNWTCTNWSSCKADGTQTRTCTESSGFYNCTSPITTKKCGETCRPDWGCSAWSTCILGKTERACYDKNNCGDDTNKPIETDPCTVTPPCEPNWDCPWSKCSVGSCADTACTTGSQYKNCTDLNSCGTITGKPPVEYRNCSVECTPDWSCGDWGSCVDGKQSRYCQDKNKCGQTVEPSMTTQYCTSTTPTCKAEMSCTNWTACKDGAQTRTCMSTNGCTGDSERSTAQRCTSTCTPNWSCGQWGECQKELGTDAFVKYRTCTDSNNCGISDVYSGYPTGERCQISTENSVCTPSWACSTWTTCASDSHSRVCLDANNCGVATNKPITIEKCVVTGDCVPNWVCGSWNTCTYNTQRRTCVDLNNCRTEKDRPVITQPCATAPSVCNAKWTCTAWSDCRSDNNPRAEIGYQFRTCNDANDCNQEGPPTSQSCAYNSLLPTLDLIFPKTAGGDVLVAGQPYAITWTSSKVATISKIELINLDLDPNLTKKPEERVQLVIAKNIPNTNSYLWTVPTAYTGNHFQLEIAGDTSDGVYHAGDLTFSFSIVASSSSTNCTDGNWMSTLSPTTCPSNGLQTKTWTKVGTCSGGVSHPTTETVGCTYQYTPVCMEADWRYTLSPLSCPTNGVQTKLWQRVNICTSGVSHPDTEQISCTYAAPTCASFTYSDWSACSFYGQQTRTVTVAIPYGCAGGNPVITRSCNPFCTASNWTFTLSPATCPSTGIQTRTWTKAGVCSGGVTYPASDSVTCTPPAPTCTSFTYSSWDSCSSGTQRRTVVFSYPSGCAGGSPIITQSCSTAPIRITYPNGGETLNQGQKYTITWDVQSYTGVKMFLLKDDVIISTIQDYIPNNGYYDWTVPTNFVGTGFKIAIGMLNTTSILDSSDGSFTITASTTVCTDSNWTYALSPSICPSTGTQTRTWTKVGTCSGGVSHPTTETAGCTYQALTCTSFTYSTWSACSSSGVKTRTVSSSYPSGCTGGSPVISESCTFSSGCAENDWSYALSPTICPSYLTQIKTWTKVGTCSGGVSHPSSETVDCTYQAPSITVTSPNGGETWKVGETKNITWTSAGMPSDVRVYVVLLDQQRNNTYYISNLISLANGTYSWTIPETITDPTLGAEVSTIGTKFKIRIYSQDFGYDESNNYFSITAPTAFNNASQDSLASISSAIQKIAEELRLLLNR